MTPQVMALMARHGAERYAGAEDSLLQLLSDLWPAHEVSLVVGDSASDAKSNSLNGFVSVPVSSQAWEFGTWDVLISEHAQRGKLKDNDLVVLATSAYRNNYTSYHELMDRSRVGRLVNRPFVVGHMDRYDEPVAAFGYEFQHWLRSSLVILPASALWRVAPITAELPKPEALFTEDPANPFRDDAYLSPNYRDYILHWLTGEGTGQGVRWENAQPLQSMGMDRFRAKCHAIFREHMLTRKFYALGLEVWDATYLATVCESESVDRAPSWRYQMAHRFRDAATSSEWGGSGGLADLREWSERSSNARTAPCESLADVPRSPTAKGSVGRSGAKKSPKKESAKRKGARKDLVVSVKHREDSPHEGERLINDQARRRDEQRLREALEESVDRLTHSRLALRSATTRVDELTAWNSQLVEDLHGLAQHLRAVEEGLAVRTIDLDLRLAETRRLREGAVRLFSRQQVYLDSRTIRIALWLSGVWRKIKGTPSVPQIASLAYAASAGAKCLESDDGGGIGAWAFTPATDYVDVLASGVVDSEWYVSSFPGVQDAGTDPTEDFTTAGWLQGRSPSAMFDVEFYLKTYPDVAQVGVNPLVHYLRTGWREGRSPSQHFSAEELASRMPEGLRGRVCPLVYLAWSMKT